MPRNPSHGNPHRPSRQKWLDKHHPSVAFDPPQKGFLPEQMKAHENLMKANPQMDFVDWFEDPNFKRESEKYWQWHDRNSVPIDSLNYPIKSRSSKAKERQVNIKALAKASKMLEEPQKAIEKSFVPFANFWDVQRKNMNELVGDEERAQIKLTHYTDKNNLNSYQRKGKKAFKKFEKNLGISDEEERKGLRKSLRKDPDLALYKYLFQDVRVGDMLNEANEEGNMLTKRDVLSNAFFDHSDIGKKTKILVEKERKRLYK